MPAHFVGNVDARWLIDDGEDRKMQLLANFTFIDSTNFTWQANVGDIVDGTSIPEAVWSEVVGTPFIGEYRRASVVHDVACDKHIKTSKEAHRMFYEAMLVDGTSSARALLFYTAVRLFGPQWEAAAGGITNKAFKRALPSKTIERALTSKNLRPSRQSTGKSRKTLSPTGAFGQRCGWTGLSAERSTKHNYPKCGETL